MTHSQASTAFSRRDVLRLATAWGLSFAAPSLAPRQARAAGPARPKSLIVLWMNGGPSQLETWDPHPYYKNGQAGSQVGKIKTALPGLEIADLYPQTAEQIQHLNVIRSLVSKEGDHERGTYMVKTGYRPDPTLRHPTLAAIVQHELPSDTLKLPNHITLCDSQWPSWGGYLGAEHDAFKVFNPGMGLHNLEMGVEKDRQKQRKANLSVLENSFRRGRVGQFAKTLHSETLHRALAMMDTEQLKAFDISTESETLRKSYGDNAFGRGCLVARRLVETGVRSVEVSLNGWDSHAQNLSFHKTNSLWLDPGLATLIRDLHERDLLASTVVLCLGEFGRTPKVNPLEGRDHWPTGFSCLVGGGGLRSGVVLGATDPTGQKATPQRPVEVPQVYATILKLMGIEPGKEVLTPIGRPMAFCAGKPLPELLPG